MSAPLLVVDSHYLAHRAFHTSGHLEWRGRATGVTFGFLKTILSLKQEFYTDRIAFCFEGQDSYRRSIYPQYKATRKYNRTVEEDDARKVLAKQIYALRTEHLPSIGFNNVFCYEGMESDDVMAVMAEQALESDSVVLVTADHDLFQCLRPNVSIYNPQQAKLQTYEWFLSHYEITPKQWAVVKAIAGCKGDNVIGIRGVGEKTAVKFVQGRLTQSSVAYQDIMCGEGKAIVCRNRQLVQLPLPHCPVPTMQEDNVTRRGWVQVCSKLGMRSLAGRPPVAFGKKIAA